MFLACCQRYSKSLFVSSRGCRCVLYNPQTIAQEKILCAIVLGFEALLLTEPCQLPLFQNHPSSLEHWIVGVTLDAHPALVCHHSVRTKVHDLLYPNVAVLYVRNSREIRLRCIEQRSVYTRRLLQTHARAHTYSFIMYPCT